jgi:hypothetical protein
MKGWLVAPKPGEGGSRKWLKRKTNKGENRQLFEENCGAERAVPSPEAHREYSTSGAFYAIQ